MGYVAPGRPHQGETGATGFGEQTTAFLMRAAAPLKLPDIATAIASRRDWSGRPSDGSIRRTTKNRPKPVGVIRGANSWMRRA